MQGPWTCTHSNTSHTHGCTQASFRATHVAVGTQRHPSPPEDHQQPMWGRRPWKRGVGSAASICTARCASGSKPTPDLGTTVPMRLPTCLAWTHIHHQSRTLTGQAHATSAIAAKLRFACHRCTACRPTFFAFFSFLSFLSFLSPLCFLSPAGLGSGTTLAAAPFAAFSRFASSRSAKMEPGCAQGSAAGGWEDGWEGLAGGPGRSLGKRGGGPGSGPEIKE